jgi:hypothetical protein
MLYDYLLSVKLVHKQILFFFFPLQIISKLFCLHLAHVLGTLCECFLGLRQSFSFRSLKEILIGNNLILITYLRQH